MNEFKNYHPVANFIYFFFAIVFSCIYMHPICLGISLVCSFVYMSMLKGAKAVRRTLVYIIPLMIITACLNPLFNHRGITIVSYLPNGNPITAEAVAYGLGAACMIASVIMWFGCFNEVITSDKIIYLFGKILPSLSLILSMTFRFVPKFKKDFTEISQGQKCLGTDMSTGSLPARCKSGVRILSVMISRSLEESIDTADSMKSRGFGLKGRTAFSNFRWSYRDGATVALILALSLCIILGGIRSSLSYSYFPIMPGLDFSPRGLSLYIVYAIYLSIPIAVEIKEARKWKP